MPKTMNLIENTKIFEKGYFENNLKDKTITQCKDCPSKKLTTVDGYLVCSKCGLVLQSIISDEAEWNNYTNKDGSKGNNSRCGGSTAYDINPFIDPLSTFLPKGSKSFINKEGRYIEYDISKLHIQNSYNHLQKSYNQVELIIDSSTADRYSKTVVTTAKKLWAEIMKSKKLTRGGVRKGLIACCIYYSCIHHDCPRSPIEVCRDFGLPDTKNFNKGDKEFKETFEREPMWAHLLTKNLSTDNYFMRLCSKLETERCIKEGTSFVLSKKCKEFYENNKDELESVFPKSAACGIIFYICKKESIAITKSKLSKTLGICAPTLSKTLKIIENL
jgi:transcription initiation factor TFIIIB Brf1 subunit/transcription initiation factor TFIIB